MSYQSFVPVLDMLGTSVLSIKPKSFHKNFHSKHEKFCVYSFIIRMSWIFQLQIVSTVKLCKLQSDVKKFKVHGFGNTFVMLFFFPI